jgi:hypothetical protein
VIGQLHASAALPLAPLDRRLGGHKSRSERYGEEILPCRGSNPGRPARSPSQHRLSHPGSSLRLVWKDSIKLYHSEDVAKLDLSSAFHDRRDELLGAMLATIS